MGVSAKYGVNLYVMLAGSLDLTCMTLELFYNLEIVFNKLQYGSLYAAFFRVQHIFEKN